jgi:hypothetical protein
MINNPNSHSPFAHLINKVRNKHLNNTPNTPVNSRAEFTRAEAALKAARDKLEKETRREGHPVAGLFANSHFIERSSGERWVQEARNEFLAREEENFQHVAHALENLAPASPAENKKCPGKL